MKCQRCDKPATFHITELEGGKLQELHLCEDCARQYLTQGSVESTPATMAGALAQHLAVGQTAEELARLDQKACPVCGITFYEFRNQGRLGCPHDYIFFEKELDPLIMNIHGETTHTGKRPERLAAADAPRIVAPCDGVVEHRRVLAIAERDAELGEPDEVAAGQDAALGKTTFNERGDTVNQVIGIYCVKDGQWQYQKAADIPADRLPK